MYCVLSRRKPAFSLTTTSFIHTLPYLRAAKGKAWATLQRVKTMTEVRALKTSRFLLMPSRLFQNVTGEYLAPPTTSSSSLHGGGGGPGDRGDSPVAASDWRRHVRGILIEIGDHHENVTASDLLRPPTRGSKNTSDSSSSSTPAAARPAYFPFSPAETYPQSALRPEGDPGNQTWNPSGTGATVARFDDLPIVFLDAQGTDLARTFAEKNAAGGYAKIPNRVASADFTMQAAAEMRGGGGGESTTMTSKTCLEERKCLPVGGFSVIASVPPLLPSPPSPSKTKKGNKDDGVVLVSARLDASSLFHDLAAGANAAMSGLIVMLAAAKAYNEAVQRAAPATNNKIRQKPVVFAAFAAEDWGYAGSRRFYHDLLLSATTESGGLELGGLVGRHIDALVELGALGLATRRVPKDVETPTVFAHVNARGGKGSDAVVTALRAAAAAASEAGKGGITILRAKGAPKLDSGGGDIGGGGHLIPPSSMFSFMRRKPDINGVLLAEYDGEYIDPFHGSVFDAGVEAIDAGRMARVAAALARGLATMSFAADADTDDKSNDASVTATAAAEAVAAAVEDTSVASTTAELVECLVDKNIGFQCPLARRLFSASEKFPSRYVGVIPGLLDNTQHPLGKSDMQRFVWNFLGNATAEANSSRASCAGYDVGDCQTGGQSQSGEVCVGATGIGLDASDDMAGGAAGVGATKGSEIEGEGKSESLKNDVLEGGGGPPRSGRRRSRSLLGGGDNKAGGDGGDGTEGNGARTGSCLRAYPRFVPAFSPRLSFDRKKAKWTVSDASEEEAALSGGADPVWAESNWPGNIGVVLYQHEGDARDFSILVLGVVITCASYVLARRFDEQVKERLKEA